MKKFIFVLLIHLFIFLPSCKVFENKDPIYYDIAKAFTEQVVKKLFNLDSFSFEKNGNLDIARTFQYSELQRIFGDKILAKLTKQGYAKLENELISTEITWKPDGNDKYYIHYYRQKKGVYIGSYRFYKDSTYLKGICKTD